METRTDGFRKTGADHTEVMLDIAIDALKSHDTIQPALKRTGVTVGGCTKTRNGEIRNGKWGNAEMRKWGMENKSVAARGSAVSEAVAEAEDW